MPIDSTFVRRINEKRQLHRCHLWFAAAIVVLACLLTVRDDQRVALRPLPNVALPESCPSKIYFGIDCPGCGLTRSFIHLAAGNLAASFATHRVGWLLALAVLGQFPYRWFVLRRLRHLATSSEASAAESGPVKVIESDSTTATRDDLLSHSTESPIDFKTPAWIESFAKLLLVALLGNWILKVLGY
ncbi:MAG: DUF2752 domain-containing protein [Planctomycetota bacterium]